MKKSEIKVMPEYFDRYINLVEDIDVISALEKFGIPVIQTETNNIEKLGDKIYAPNKWTVKDIIQHITDTERVFAYRALRFARKDLTALSGFDENIYASQARASDRKLEDIINDFDNVRQSSISLFKSFDEEMMLSEGISSNNKISVLAIGFMIAGHFIHHINVIKERYYPLIK